MSNRHPPAQVLRRCEHCGAAAQPSVCAACGRLTAPDRPTTPLRRFVAADTQITTTNSRWSRR